MAKLEYVRNESNLLNSIEKYCDYLSSDISNTKDNNGYLYIQDT